MSAQLNEHVAILLSTFNGEEHLARQLDSILAQQHRHWTVYASDDGSTDATLRILQDYRVRCGADRMVIVQGPRAGYADNFMSLVRSAQVTGDFFAFCDQDDCWDPDKLARALDWMRRQPTGIPALYCGRTRLIDADDRMIGYSPLFSRAPGFRNALVQSLAGGNTMLLNAAARELMAQSAGSVISHDWWAYLVVSGCGGTVYYDAHPAIGYRQHEDNLIGSAAGVRSRLQRLKSMLEGSYEGWNAINLPALRALEQHLSPESLTTLAMFERARRVGLVGRLSLLLRARLYRQTFAGDLALLLAALLGKL
jgi:glycosyltransferase involved in cell wall biosynthesis